MSEAVAVGTLGVAIILRRCLDLESLYEEEEGWEEDGNVVVVNQDDYRSGLLCEPSSSTLVKVPGHANCDLLRVVD